VKLEGPQRLQLFRLLPREDLDRRVPAGRDQDLAVRGSDLLEAISLISFGRNLRIIFLKSFFAAASIFKEADA
jgi:hypothetical protein